MSRAIRIQPLNAVRFRPFGDVLSFDGAPDLIINQGRCGRYHNLAALDFSDGAAGISLFDAQPRRLPCQLPMMERHPLGSQAFIPLTEHPFIVLVAADHDGQPGPPLAFISAPHTGVNYHKNTWHGVLTPLHAPGRFAVIDRIGGGTNVEEFWFPQPYTICT